MIEIAMNTYKGLIKQLFISLKELIGFLSFLVHYQIVNFSNIAIAMNKGPKQTQKMKQRG